MIPISTNWKLIAAGVLAVAVATAIVGIYLKGRGDGRALAEADAKTAVIRQLKERNVTDEKVDRLSAADLCRDLGGVFRDGRCE